MDDGGSPNTGFFKKIFHKLPFKDSEDVTEEEIISMVNEGHEQGVLRENEAEMIHNIFEFGAKGTADFLIGDQAKKEPVSGGDCLIVPGGTLCGVETATGTGQK